MRRNRLLSLPLTDDKTPKVRSIYEYACCSLIHFQDIHDRASRLRYVYVSNCRLAGKVRYFGKRKRNTAIKLDRKSGELRPIPSAFNQAHDVRSVPVVSD